MGPWVVGNFCISPSAVILLCLHSWWAALQPAHCSWATESCWELQNSALGSAECHTSTHWLWVWPLAGYTLSLVKYTKKRNENQCHHPPWVTQLVWNDLASGHLGRADRWTLLQPPPGKGGLDRGQEEKLTLECLGHPWIGAGIHAGLPQPAEKSQCLVGAKNHLFLFKPLHFSHLKPLPVLYLYPWSSSSQLLKALHHSPAQLPAREHYITDPHWVLCPSFFFSSSDKTWLCQAPWIKLWVLEGAQLPPAQEGGSGKSLLCVISIIDK